MIKSELSDYLLKLQISTLMYKYPYIKGFNKK